MDSAGRAKDLGRFRIADLVANAEALREQPGGDYSHLDHSTAAKIQKLLKQCPAYKPTPLIALDRAANMARVAAIQYKDESHRFSLKSFKSMGAVIGAARQLARHLNLDPTDGQLLTDIFSGAYADRLKGITLTAATAGNHGRAVAAAARVFGIDAVIYVPQGTKAGRIQALEQQGAEARVYPGSYDDAVREAEREAKCMGWMVISDTAYPGYHVIPRDIMSGYCAIGLEVLEAAPVRPDKACPFTHIFLQGGVGSLSGALTAYFANRYGADRPVTVIVEPERADCITASVRAGKRVAVDKDLATSMAGLAAAEVSEVAWPIFRDFADFCIALPDDDVEDTVRGLADCRYADTPIEAGESAVAGLIAALAVAGDEDARGQIGLAEDSRILVIGTEGATDPEAFKRITGRKPWVKGDA